jgi:glycosyltransferase involved in cell wall biosynthesis
MAESKKWRSKVGACFIMKNEEKNIERMISSMRGCWDEGCLVMVDTGSTDRTVELAESLGAKVEHFEWIDDFGAARQFALEKLYENCPDIDYWMWSDLDDVLLCQDDIEKYRQTLDDCLDNPNIQGLNFPYIYSHDASEVGNQCIPQFKYHRLRACKKGFGRWKCRIHEYIESDQSKHVNCENVDFHHFRDGTGVMNTARNLRILRKVVDEATPAERPRYTFYYGKECMYNGLFDDAEKAFKEYLPISNWLPEKTRAMYELAVCYQYKGDLENCMRYAFEAIILDQRYADPYVLLGLLAYAKQDWKMCAAWMGMVPQLGKPETFFFDYIPYNTYVPWDYMSVAYWHFDHEKGKEAILKALAYRPHDSRFLFNWTQFFQTDKVTIVIPTYNRKEKLLNCIAKIKEAAVIKNYEILVGVDGNEEYFKELAEALKDDPKVTIRLYSKQGAPNIVENLINETDAKYVAYLGDDCEPRMGFLIHAFIECDGKNLVCFNDRVWEGKIACHWFAPKDLRDKLGGFFFYRGYNHVGCDNELTDKATKLGLYKFSPTALVDHVHYIQNICTDKNKVAEEDDTYKLGWNEETVRKDRRLLTVRASNNYISDSEIININVGGGNTKIEGYLNLDKYSPTADIKKDILEPGLFQPESIDKFLLNHVLEHFIEPEAQKVVETLYTALKSGGALEIHVPDLSKIMEVSDPEYRKKVLYGWQLPGMYHRWGYDKDSLRKVLETAGFRIVSLDEGYQYDAPELCVIAVKP